MICKSSETFTEPQPTRADIDIASGLTPVSTHCKSATNTKRSIGASIAVIYQLAWILRKDLRLELYSPNTTESGILKSRMA
jgi:hypothetical protein